MGEVKRFLSNGESKQLITVIGCFNMPVLIAVENPKELVAHTSQLRSKENLQNHYTNHICDFFCYINAISQFTKNLSSSPPVFELLLRFVVDLQKGLRRHLLASQRYNLGTAPEKNHGNVFSPPAHLKSTKSEHSCTYTIST